jgi:hypothetical protein
MARVREGDPRFGARRHNSGDRRPQTGDEQDAGERSDHLRRRNRAIGCRDRAVQQSSADQQSLNQKPRARRAVRERGEKPLHLYPIFSLRKSQRLGKITKGKRPIPLLGDLQFDDPALKPDGDGVRAVVRSQLLEDAGDVLLHRILSNRKLGGDLLVGVPLRDQI